MKDENRDTPFESMLGPALTRSMSEGSSACPDAETLAAWSDNGLTAAQRTQIEAHLAGCARCQALVAAAARGAMAPSASPAREAGWLSWRWLVPAAAGATALVAWLVFQPGVRPPVEESTSARAEQTVEPAGQPKPAAQPSEPAAPANAPARETESRANALRDDARSAKAAPSERASADRQTAADSELKLRKEEAGAAAAQSSAAAARSGGAAPSAAAPAATAPAAALPPAAEQRFQAADTISLREIVSNTPLVRWRIRGAEVEHSSDGGVTWTRQPTGTTVALTAGASPSPDVCWIVGRQGTVLRSIDGRTWQTVRFPERIDLIQVESMGPEQATVTTIDARRFTTADGGATWRAGGLQEF